jgi:hypothetical protein
MSSKINTTQDTRDSSVSQNDKIACIFFKLWQDIDKKKYDKKITHYNYIRRKIAWQN